jgi:hypothetical protein
MSHSITQITADYYVLATKSYKKIAGKDGENGSKTETSWTI